MELRLYEISDQIASIIGQEEWTEETEKALEGLEMALEKKAENVLSYMENLDSFAERCRAEEKRIASRRKSAEDRAKDLKGYLSRCMKLADRDEIKAGTWRLTTQKNPPHVVIDNEADIPPKYFIIIPEAKKLDKNSLSSDLMKGPQPGAHLEQSERLVIK